MRQIPDSINRDKKEFEYELKRQSPAISNLLNDVDSPSEILTI
jgi:hypothetical protein